MLKCVMAIGTIFLTAEDDGRAVNAARVQSFEISRCGKFDDSQCLHGRLDTSQRPGWRLPNEWTGLPVTEVLARCEAEAREKAEMSQLN